MTRAHRRPRATATCIVARPFAHYGDDGERKRRFLALSLEEERAAASADADDAPHILHRNDWFFAPFKDSPVAAADISVDVSGLDITLSTDLRIATYT